MRRLTPYDTATPVPCLASFYRRRIRDGRNLYDFMLGYRPGAAPERRRNWWARLWGTKKPAG